MKGNNTGEKTVEGYGEGYDEGRIPKWLFLIWVVFIIWGAIYLVYFAIPDFKNWLTNPPIEQSENR